MSQATTGFSSQGSELYIRIAGLGFRLINQIRGLDGPGIADDIADITTLSSPGGFKEKLPLMKDGTPVSFELVWNPADTVVRRLQTSKATYPAPLEEFYEIASDPNKDTVHFFGYVTKFQRQLQHGKEGTVSVEVMPSGEQSFSYGVSPA